MQEAESVKQVHLINQGRVFGSDHSGQVENKVWLHTLKHFEHASEVINTLDLIMAFTSGSRCQGERFHPLLPQISRKMLATKTARACYECFHPISGRNSSGLVSK